MRAIILAGGKGRRLQPYTTILPKPLMPVGDQPILEIVVRQLRRAGFTHLTFAVGHLAGLIQAYFSNGDKFGIKIDYSMEESPLGTAGPLTLISPPTDDFLMMNGDLLTDLNFADLMQAHRRQSGICTVAAYRKTVPISLGVLEIDDQRVIGYTEKPTYEFQVSTGIYCFRPDVLRHLTPGTPCDLPDLILKLVGQGELVSVYRFDGRWLDIGRPEDYEIALAEFDKGGF